MWIIILLPTAAASALIYAPMIIIGLAIIGVPILAVYKALEFLVANWVCVVLIAVIGIIYCSIWFKSGKFNIGRCFTLLVSVGLIIGVIIAKPEIKNGKLFSDFIGYKHEHILYKEGQKYYNAYNYTNAITLFSKTINQYELRQAEHDKYNDAKLDIAFRKGGGFKPPIRRITTDHINSYYLRGRAYFKTENYNAAITDYEMVVRLLPETQREFGIAPFSTEIFAYIGDAYGAKKEYDKVVSYYENYLELKSPDEPIDFTVDKSYPADMWVCATLWKKKLLNKDSKYEKWLAEICNKNPVTRAEIEAFYKQNRGQLDKWLSKKT